MNLHELHRLNVIGKHWNIGPVPHKDGVSTRENLSRYTDLNAILTPYLEFVEIGHILGVEGHGRGRHGWLGGVHRVHNWIATKGLVRVFEGNFSLSRHLQRQGTRFVVEEYGYLLR